MTLLLTHTACLDHVTPPGHPERPDRIRVEGLHRRRNGVLSQIFG